MLFDNPIFAGWYTDTVDIYRVEAIQQGNRTAQERRKINASPVPCRVYNTSKGGPSMDDGAARVRGEDKLSCDLSVDIRAGDELQVVRGGNLGRTNQPVRYFAGAPQDYYDPVGGALTGLEHQEVGLLRENLVG